MTRERSCAALVAILFALAGVPPVAPAQPSPPSGNEAAAGIPSGQPSGNAAAAVAGPAGDCSRWPASVFDGTAALCRCPEGMWWNLRGDACLPREHATAEFCSTVWPGSQPLLIEGGGYRCVCAPPLLWDEDAHACRVPVEIGLEECTREWPGTAPVMAPAGTEFECRCPGGGRWNEAGPGCASGAPLTGAPRGFFDPYPRGPGGREIGAPAGDPAAVPPAADGATGPPAAGAGAPPYGPKRDAGAGREGDGDDASPVAPGGNGQSAACEALLAEIRGRAAAGQRAEVDALGMRAAVRGCDPTAISEAVRGSAAPQ